MPPADLRRGPTGGWRKCGRSWPARGWSPREAGSVSGGPARRGPSPRTSGLRREGRLPGRKSCSCCLLAFRSWSVLQLRPAGQANKCFRRSTATLTPTSATSSSHALRAGPGMRRRSTHSSWPSRMPSTMPISS